MAKMADEFPQYSRIHTDWEFTLKAKNTKKIKNTKKFRILAIQNEMQNHQHAAIIISELGQEYVQLPDLVEKFLVEIQRAAQVNSTNNFEDKVVFCPSSLKFTKNVYLYTDRLLVSEEAIRKHFKKNNLALETRIINKSLTL